MRKIAIASIAASLLASTSVYSQAGYVPGGPPTVDCTQVYNTLDSILCRGPEAARADWDLYSAVAALYPPLSDKQGRMQERDDQAWRHSLDANCALPAYLTPEVQFGLGWGRSLLPELRIPGPRPIAQVHVNCVLKEFHARAAMLRSKLTGDALAESQTSPEQHAEIQVALAEKSFGSGTPDGKFGPITRKAIKEFQRTLGASPSGFLSDDQRSALFERPAEREARRAREAADAKARADAVVAQAAAAEKIKQDAQIAAERQAAQAAADENAKRDRVEAESDAAKEWGRRVEAAREKGTQYADQARTKWSLSEQNNPMTDEKDYTVTSVQPNEKGAKALIEGSCIRKPGRVVFLASLNEMADRNTPLALPTFENMTIVGDKRINDDGIVPTRFKNDTFRNRIVVATLSSRDLTESIETTWLVRARVESSLGFIFIEIPMFDVNVQKLLVTCKRQGELFNRRGGFPDVPKE
jgi:peptidoglycan hydrolase-like protein with peptidoglycan-binding domain